MLRKAVKLFGKIRNFEQKLLILLGLAFVFMLRFVVYFPCAVKKFFGIPCPGCGISGAYFHLLKGEFAAAFSTHPMFWAIPVFILYFLFDGRLFKNRIINITVFVLLIIGFLINYIYKLNLGGYLNVL